MAHSPAETLFAAVAADNPTFPRFLTPANVIVDTPIALSGDTDGKNTSVVVTGSPGNGLKDSVTLKYNRVGFADIIAASANPSNIVPATGQVTQADMLVSFNSRYGAHLTADDVVAASIGDLTGGYRGLTLTPVDGHLLYNAAAEIKYPGTYPTLTLTGSFATPSNVGSAYASTIAIAGGNGTYKNVRLGTGTLPGGLTLSIVGATLKLAGSSTLMGTYAFTAKVDSDDGQTATSTMQTVIIDGELDKLITFPTLSGLVAGDVTGVVSATAFFARLNTDNATLPVPLTTSNVNLSAPTALSGDASLRNTSLVVTGKAGGYVNSQTIHYNRLDFANVITGHVANQNWTTQASSSDLLVAVNAATGFAIATSDIVVEALPTNPQNGTTVNYSIKASATSLGFTGTGIIGLVSQAPAPTISGTLTPDATIGTGYSSGLVLTGAAPFTNPRLDTTAANAATALPAGLTLSISGNNVVLSGTPTGTAASAKNYYIAVDTADGHTITTPAQSIQVNRGQFVTFAGGQKATNITLSGTGSTIATRNDTVQGAGVVSVGGFLLPIKYYWEVLCITLGTSLSINNFSTVYIGYKQSAEAVASTYPGRQSGTNSIGYNTAEDGANGHGRVYSNLVLGSQGPYLANGDVLGVAVDATVLTAVKLWFSKNGVWMQGDPAAGTLPMATIDMSVGSYLPAIGTVRGNFNGQQAQSVAIHASPATLTYPAPAGYAKGHAI